MTAMAKKATSEAERQKIIEEQVALEEASKKAMEKVKVVSQELALVSKEASKESSDAKPKGEEGPPGKTKKRLKLRQ